MPPIANKLTTQQGLLVQGQTGVQVVTFIPGARVYMKTTSDPIQAAVAPQAKLDGSTPAGGWIDLGSLDGDITLKYQKNKTDVNTGIDKVLRASYISSHTFELTWNLLQMDDYTLSKTLGLSPSILTPGSAVSFSLGQEAYGQYALLIVWQNKLDGKENQLYHPAAYLDSTVDKNSDRLVVKCEAKFPAFTQSGQSVESLAVHSIFA